MEVPNSKKIKVIDSLWTFSVAVALLGPFALPLLWRNPRFERSTKIAGSIFILVLTVWLIWFSGKYLSGLNDQIQQLKSIQESSP